MINNGLYYLIGQVEILEKGRGMNCVLKIILLKTSYNQNISDCLMYFMD